jgi:hypothetical protein
MTLDEHDSDHKNYEMMASTLKPTKWKLSMSPFYHPDNRDSLGLKQWKLCLVTILSS